MKKKILIPIFIIMICLITVVTASWQILNYKENKVPSEYFPYEVNAVQNVTYDGKEHDVTISLTEGSIVDNDDLIIDYYKYSTSLNKDEVIHNITLLQNEKPKNYGIYIAKIYRMVAVNDELRGITQKKEEIYNVRLNINKRQVTVSSYADKDIYFGQDTSTVTFGYDIEEATEGSNSGLILGDELKESSSFVLDSGYKKYQPYGVCTIAISGLYDVNDNYEIIYKPGEFHVNQLPISFSWDNSSLKTVYSGKYQRPSISTYSTKVEGVDMNELLENVDFNAIYDTDATKLINAGVYDVECTGFDNKNLIFDNSGSTEYLNTTFEIEKCKVNYSWYTDTERRLTFNGTNQHQKAYLTTLADGSSVEMVVDSFKLLENESNNNERDTTYINYKTLGEVEANVNKDGNKLFSDLYTIELLSLSNPNYEFAEGDTSTKYKIYPKELTLNWHQNNSFVFNNTSQLVKAEEVGVVENYPSGLYFDGEQINANYVNEETMIPSYTNSNDELITFNKYYSTAKITSTNYYLSEDSIKNEFKIIQLEVFINWDDLVEFDYSGQMNSHCPSGEITLESGYPDAGLTILGSQVNANSDHLGNKYNGFADYSAQAVISNTNYKLLQNTTCAFKVKASPLVVGINEALPEGASGNVTKKVTRNALRSTSYDDITYEYFGKSFTPQAYYDGELYEGDDCSVYIKYVNENGTFSEEGALDVGTYLAKTVGLSNTNYSILEEKTINVIINPRPLNIEWDNLAFNYDSNSHLPTVSISNLCEIDIPTNPNAAPLVYVRVDNSYAQTNANITYSSGSLIAGFSKYDVALTSSYITNEAGETVKKYLVYGSRGHNYICSSDTICENTFTIKQAQLTINALKNEITYGDVPSLSKTSHISLVGLQVNDTIDSLIGLTYDINYSQYQDVTNSSKNVSYEAIWIGVTNTNYEITYNSAEFVVNRKPVTINWDNVTTHVYSSSLWAPSAIIDGLVNNDKVSVDIGGKQKDTNVKTGLTYNAIVNSLISDDSFDQADNYIISNPDTTQPFTITQRPVTVNWLNANLTYTGDLQFAEYELIGVLNNEDLAETISGEQTNANRNSKGVFGDTYKASITAITNLNYMFATDADIEEEFYINALAISVKWNTVNFTYNGKTQLPTILSLATILTDDISSVSTNITASSESEVVGFIAGCWAGSHKATASLTGAKASNYEITDNMTFDYNIGKAPLQFILNNKTITYGDAPVDNGYEVLGFVNGETVSVLGNSISYSHSYSHFGNVGDYAINASGFTSNNYEITYQPATLTVEARKVEIAFTDLDSYVYKKGEYSPIAIVTNLARSSDVCTVELTKFINAGEHTSTVVSISNSNYTIVGTNYSHKFTITPKPITINWNGYEGLIYNKKVQELSVGSNDIISGDTVNYTISYTTGGKNAGNHTAKVVIDNSNYTIAANETKTYSIAKKDININWSSNKVIYCNSEVMPEVEVTGFIDGDSSVTVTYNNKGRNVGSYTVNVVLSDDTNYYIATGASCDYEITPKTVTINWSDVDYTYRKDYIAPTPTVDGLIDGDTSVSITVTYSGDNLVDGKAIYVGDYVAMASVVGQHPANYTIVSGASKDFTITPKPITINWSNLEFTYNGSPFVPTATAEGLFEGDTCTLTVSGSAIEVGTHAATVTGISNTNYKLPTNVSTTFEILPIVTITTLTVTIYGNVTISYGDDLVLEYVTQVPSGTNSKLYYTITGFRDGDSIDSLDGQLSLTTNYSKGSFVGTYSIDGIATGFEQNDSYEYEYVFVGNTIIVNPKLVTVTWIQKSFEYDGYGHLPEYKLNGILTDDECSIEFKNSSGAALIAPTDYRNGGYTANISLTNNNYALESESVQFDITQRELEISWDKDNLVYTGSSLNPVSFTNILLGHEVKAIFDKDIVGAGEYTVTITGLTGIHSSNYKLPTDSIEESFTVKRAQITIDDTWITISPFIEGTVPTFDSLSGQFEFNGKTLLGTYYVVDSMFTSINYGGTSETWDSTIKIKFTPNDLNNFEPLEHDTEFTMYAVAKIGNTYYGTIHKAIEAANAGSNKNVYVIPGLTYNYGFNIIVKENITIPSGVTLYIPYEGTNCSSSSFASLSGSSYSDKDANAIKTNRQTLISLINGADIIIESGASLYLGGETHRIGVTGKYCEINLDTGSMIDCSGTFECYGYIKENKNSYKNGSQNDYNTLYSNDFDEGRMIRVNSSGKLLTVLAIYSNLSAMGTLNNYNNAKVFPFTKFDFPNLQTYVEINYGGTFSSKIFMQITSSSTNIDVNEEVKVVGTSDGIFKLKSNGTETNNIAFEYCPKNIENTNTEGITRVFINGAVEQGYVNMKIYTETVTTSDKFIPLSYKFNIFINSGGNYSSSYQIKFLPGSKLLINSGGMLTIDNELIFYEGTEASKIQSYGNTTDAILINNGTIKLTSRGKLGAFIQTEVSDNSAMLDFSETTSSDAFTASAIEGENSVGVTRTSKGLFVDESSEGKSYYQFVSNSIVYSDENGGMCWDGEKFNTVSLNVTVQDEGVNNPIFGYQVVMADDSAGGGTQVKLTSDMISAEQEFSLAIGKYVKIDVSRHQKAVIKYLNSGQEMVHDSSTWYLVTEDLEVIITPNEGVSLQVTTDNMSGCGWTTFNVYESIDGNSNWYLVAEFIGNPKENTTYVVKDWYFKIEIELDPYLQIADSLGQVKSELDPANYKITPSYNGDPKFEVDKAYQAFSNYVVHIARKDKGSSSCLSEGTLITMFDGSKIGVEDIKPGDKLLVFNHETGKYDIAEVLFNDSEDISTYTVINLEFSNNSIVKVISEHGFFDLDLMKYVYIDGYNYKDYIGHRFVSAVMVNGEMIQSIVTLDNAYLTEEYIKVYSPVTKYHMNYLTEDILSMPGGISGLFNIFEYDDNLQYNQELMEKDIDEYGLFTYEDFKDLVSYEVYSSFATQYFKVAIAKGYLTWEQLYYYIERYGPLV